MSQFTQPLPTHSRHPLDDFALLSFNLVPDDLALRVLPSHDHHPLLLLLQLDPQEEAVHVDIVG
jgi:hypothetical protein